jgi:GT2 family glycosyltransferase
MISIVTPFHNCPELIPDYEKAVQGSQVIVIDNASDDDTAVKLQEMIERLGNGSKYIRNDVNQGYSKANNQGLAVADGEIVVFLNSDIIAIGSWLDKVQNAKKSAIYSPTTGVRIVDDEVYRYLEGWCLFGHKSDFESIGGWNEIDFPGLYWEDNELCYRAEKAGLQLKQILLPLFHLSNYTSQRTPGAYDQSMANKAVFERIVREGRNAR